MGGGHPGGWHCIVSYVIVNQVRSSNLFIYSHPPISRVDLDSTRKPSVDVSAKHEGRPEIFGKSCQKRRGKRNSAIFSAAAQ